MVLYAGVLFSDLSKKDNEYRSREDILEFKETDSLIGDFSRRVCDRRRLG